MHTMHTCHITNIDYCSLIVESSIQSNYIVRCVISTEVNHSSAAPPFRRNSSIKMTHVTIKILVLQMQRCLCTAPSLVALVTVAIGSAGANLDWPQQSRQEAPPQQPWMDRSLDVDTRTDLLVNAMTVQEKMVQGLSSHVYVRKPHGAVQD